MTNPRIFKINLRRLKDWIVATSDSKDLRGLYLANESYDEVIDQIPSAIKLLFKAQHQLDVRVKRIDAENDTEKQSTDTVEYLAEIAKAA